MFWNARDLWREMIHNVGWTTYCRGWPTDYGRWPIYVGRWPSFLHINKGSLNPFKYLEMIKNYEGKMIDEVKRMEGTYRLQRMTDRLRKMTLHPIILIYHLPFIVTIISEHSDGLVILKMKIIISGYLNVFRLFLLIWRKQQILVHLPIYLGHFP